MDFIAPGIDSLKDLITYLNQINRSSNASKKQVVRELRDNLNIFYNAYLNNIPADSLIDLLSNEAIKDAIRGNFKFRQLKPGTIEPYHIADERNRRYMGWTAERLVEKIDEKIEELKNLKRMNNQTVAHLKNNTGLMLSNLYFRMKLLADFIRGPK